MLKLGKTLEQADLGEPACKEYLETISHFLELMSSRRRNRTKTDHIRFFCNRLLGQSPGQSHGLVHKGFREGDR